MSLMSMRRKMASKKTATAILWALIAVFIVGVFLWSVPNWNRGSAGRPNGTPSGFDANKVVVQVGKDKITANEFEDQYAKDTTGSRPDVDMALEMRKGTLRTLVDRLLLKQALKSLGVKDNDGTYRAKAREYTESLLAGFHKTAQDQFDQQQKNKDPKAKPKTLDELFTQQMVDFRKGNSPDGKSPATLKEDQFIRWYVNDVLMAKGERGMYDRFVEYAKNLALGDGVAKMLPSDPFAEEYVKALQTKEVKAKWVFIAARRQTQESLAAARKRAESLHDELVKTPANFDAKAMPESLPPTDVALTESAGGMLGGPMGGWIQSGDPRAPLSALTEYWAFTLKPGQMSPVSQITVLSPYMPAQIGYGFVKVEAVRDRADRGKTYDWAKEKVSVMSQTKQRYEAELGRGYLEYMHYAFTPDAKTAELQSYVAENAKDTTRVDKLRKEALNDKGIPDEVHASLAYQVALRLPNPADRIPLLIEAVPYASTTISNVHYQLGVAYAGTGKNAEAIAQYHNALSFLDDSDRTIRDQVRRGFLAIGAKKEAQAITDWLKAHDQKPAATAGGR